MLKYCFLDAERLCSETCMCYSGDGTKQGCKIINIMDKLIIPPTRPIAPTPPPIPNRR